MYPNPIDELKSFFRKGSVLSVLIAINLGVWLLTKAVYVIFFLYNQPGAAAVDNLVTHYFALPASIDVLATRPWTLVTYMFLHLDFFHILFNMLWLYWFGRIFLEYLKPRQLVVVYLLGGLAGGLLYLAAFNIFPVYRQQLSLSVALGASASIMAIVSAISFYVPNYSIQLILFGRVKIIYMAIILFMIDFFSIPGGNSGGHIAHIGGALFGFFWTLTLTRTFNNPITGFFAGIAERLRSLVKPRTNRKPPQGTYSYTRPKTDDEYNKEKKENQKKTDEILEKISRGGYESLTREEKEFLFRSSGKNNR